MLTVRYLAILSVVALYVGVITTKRIELVDTQPD